MAAPKSNNWVIWTRENSNNSQCQQLVTEAKAILQKLWNDISVQEKYLNTGMWDSQEFNDRRWQMATYIDKLLKYPATRQGSAPSVIVNTNIADTKGKISLMERETKRGNVDILDLSKSFAKWKNQTSESTLAVTKSAGIAGAKGMHWVVNVNHHSGEKGYPVGWPRINCKYNPTLDFTRYEYVKYMIKVNSNRGEVADDVTKFNFTIMSYKFFETTIDLGGRQRVWLPVTFNIRDMIKTTGRGNAPWRKVSSITLSISEKNYQHKNRMVFDVGSIHLLRFKTPVIAKLESPELILLPAKEVPIKFDLMGNLDSTKRYQIIAELKNSSGKLVSAVKSKINIDRTIMLNTAKLAPGKYQLQLKLSVNGKTCSQFSKILTFIAGPFFDN